MSTSVTDLLAQLAAQGVDVSSIHVPESAPAQAAVVVDPPRAVPSGPISGFASIRPVAAIASSAPTAASAASTTTASTVASKVEADVGVVSAVVNDVAPLVPDFAPPVAGAITGGTTGILTLLVYLVSHIGLITDAVNSVGADIKKFQV